MVQFFRIHSNRAIPSLLTAASCRLHTPQKSKFSVSLSLSQKKKKKMYNKVFCDWKETVFAFNIFSFPPREKKTPMFTGFSSSLFLSLSSYCPSVTSIRLELGSMRRNFLHHRLILQNRKYPSLGSSCSHVRVRRKISEKSLEIIPPLSFLSLCIRVSLNAGSNVLVVCNRLSEILVSHSTQHERRTSWIRV